MSEIPRTSGGLRSFLWSRHSNSGSVWTFVGLFPLLIAALYRRDARLLFIGLAFVVLNPLLFRAPRDDRAWATRVVLGEQLWLDRGFGLSRETAVVAVGAPIYVFTIVSALRRRPRRTILGLALGMPLMMLFFHMMVRLYERER